MTTEKKKQRGFILFLISGILLISLLVAATILSANPEHLKFAVLTVPGNMLCLVLSVIGIFSGIKVKFETKPDQRKRIIGIIGNSAIVLFEIAIIFIGAILYLIHSH
jgi:hypothetical protein